MEPATDGTPRGRRAEASLSWSLNSGAALSFLGPQASTIHFHALTMTKFNSLNRTHGLRGETEPAAYLTLEMMLFVLVEPPVLVTMTVVKLVWLLFVFLILLS